MTPRPPTDSSVASLALLAATAGVLMVILASSAVACRREQRNFQEQPPARAMAIASATLGSLRPGGTPPPATSLDSRVHYEENAYAIAEGKRLYEQMNCSGCHFHGGGGIGPALMDDEWIYGSRPENIFASIIQGRPNGMPSFREKIQDQQAWQIVAYVRALGGFVSKDAASGRDDHMQMTPQEQSLPPQTPKDTGSPR